MVLLRRLTCPPRVGTRSSFELLLPGLLSDRRLGPRGPLPSRHAPAPHVVEATNYPADGRASGRRRRAAPRSGEIRNPKRSGPSGGMPEVDRHVRRLDEDEPTPRPGEREALRSPAGPPCAQVIDRVPSEDRRNGADLLKTLAAIELVRSLHVVRRMALARQLAIRPSGAQEASVIPRSSAEPRRSRTAAKRPL